MDTRLSGIHHITAMAGDAQRSADFYAGTLGLRLVKRTVNFDDPGTYHLYFGDAAGNPGTLLTFFPWPGAVRGRKGAGQVDSIALSVPSVSMDYWRRRLADAGVPAASLSRFGREVVAFSDVDGIDLELVADDEADSAAAWGGGPVPAEHAIRRVYGVSMTVARPEVTQELLEVTLGFERQPGGNDSAWYRLGDARVRVARAEDPARGAMGPGIVHHIAWSTPGDSEQAAWSEKVSAAGLYVTPVAERQYFRSIYFREPGGVLFEVATAGPGMAVDEPFEALGQSLRLPPWLEPRRADIEGVLPPLQPARLPAGALR